MSAHPSMSAVGVAGSSALAIAQGVRDGSQSALETVMRCLARIEQRDTTINAFTAVYEQRALAKAASIDAARAAGKPPLGPLAGVPYSVKNLFDVKGEVTLAGGMVNARNAPASSDALLIQRMDAAGAVLVGSVNMDEHAYGFTTENSHYGVTRNPLDQSRLAGGSSGGSAACVAADMVPLSLGSDTNGSIRVPASFCGIFGLKPTFGRLPRTGSYPFVHSLDHLGPLARSVTDLALCYDALQGPDASDPGCAERPAEPVSTILKTIDVSGLRIGILDGYFTTFAKPEALEALSRAAQALGASQRVTWNGAEKARAAAFIVTGSEGGALHAARLRSSYADYEPLSRDRLVAGALIPAGWYLQAQKWRRRCQSEILQLFEKVDVLLAASTPIAAPKPGLEWLEFGGKQLVTRASIGLLTQPISSMGLPVAAVPVWPSSTLGSALPVGIQVIAAPWREDRCLAVARALEAAGITTPARMRA